MSEELQRENIRITNVELKEIKKKDGTSFKQFDVKTLNQPKGIYYTLPIKKRDGTFTKVYEFYKSVKGTWEDVFISGDSVYMEVLVDVRESDWEKNGKTGTSTYKTIRMMQPADGTPETDISEIDL